MIDDKKQAADLASYGVALMLQVAEDGWKLVNEKICPLTHPLHVTIAYLEIVDQALAEKVVQLGKSFLEEQLRTKRYTFCIDSCEPLFGSITGFVPTDATVAALKELNSALERYLSEQGFALNSHTTKDQYKPHITVRRRIFEDAEYGRINRVISKIKAEHGGPDGLCLKLDAATTITKPSLEAPKR